MKALGFTTRDARAEQALSQKTKEKRRVEGLFLDNIEKKSNNILIFLIEKFEGDSTFTKIKEGTKLFNREIFTIPTDLFKPPKIDIISTDYDQPPQLKRLTAAAYSNPSQ